MRLWLILGVALLASPGLAQQQPRQLYVTPDSRPGWTPTEAEEVQLRNAVQTYLATVDSGQAAKAFSMLTPINQQHQTEAAFVRNLTGFNDEAGKVVERKIVRITWTRDPANAPFPGIYAAVDLTSRFAKVDRHCGYIVMYQETETAPFTVMREENNYLTNAVAKQLGPGQTDAAWALVTRNCPNYPGQDRP